MSNTNYTKAEINRRLAVEHQLYKVQKDPLACSSRTFCNYSQTAPLVTMVMPSTRDGADSHLSIQSKGNV